MVIQTNKIRALLYAMCFSLLGVEGRRSSFIGWKGETHSVNASMQVSGEAEQPHVAILVDELIMPSRFVLEAM